jgi:hypothetical protein
LFSSSLSVRARFISEPDLGLGRLTVLLGSRSIDVNMYATASLVTFTTDAQLQVWLAVM